MYCGGATPSSSCGTAAQPRRRRWRETRARPVSRQQDSYTVNLWKSQTVFDQETAWCAPPTVATAEGVTRVKIWSGGGGGGCRAQGGALQSHSCVACRLGGWGARGRPHEERTPPRGRSGVGPKAQTLAGRQLPSSAASSESGDFAAIVSQCYCTCCFRALAYRNTTEISHSRISP